MLTQKTNSVYLEGILSEIDLKYGTFNRDGVEVEDIYGTIKILVEEETKNGILVSEVPVNLFAAKTTKLGQHSAAYDSIEDVKNNFVSIASAGGREGADLVRVSGKTNGRITMNEYYSNDKLVSFPRITATFINKQTPAKFKPHATFTADIVVSSIEREVDEDGVEVVPAKLNVRAILPRYGGDVDVVKFIATNPSVIDGIEHYWEPNNTYRVDGRLAFTSETYIKKATGTGFGEEIEREFTRNTSDLVIIHGSDEPLDGEFGYDINEINQGLAIRKARLAAAKEKPSRIKTPEASKTTLDDLGF